MTKTALLSLSLLPRPGRRRLRRPPRGGRAKAPGTAGGRGRSADSSKSESSNDSTTGASPAPPTETLTYGRFGTVWLYRRTPTPATSPSSSRATAAGTWGWSTWRRSSPTTTPWWSASASPLHRQAQRLEGELHHPGRRPRAAVEVRAEEARLPQLRAAGAGRLLLRRDARLRLPGPGPPSTFKGAISMGFCPDLPLVHPFCPGHGIASDPGPKGKGIVFRPASTLEQPFIAFQGTIDKVCFKDDVVKYTAQVKNGRPSSCRTSATASPRPTSGRRSSAKPSSGSWGRQGARRNPPPAAPARGPRGRPPCRRPPTCRSSRSPPSPAARRSP